jgi:hypothetical protein
MTNLSGAQSLQLKMSQVESSHQTLGRRCSITTKADLTESTHEILFGILLIIAVSG